MAKVLHHPLIFKGNMIKPIEQQAADTLLQQPQRIKIANKEYIAAPPTLATLAMVSSEITRLPKQKLNQNNIVTECLSNARYYLPIANIIAILILGAKEYNRQHEHFKLLDRLMHKKSKREILIEQIKNTLTPKQLNDILAQLLQGMELSDFFAISTFLTEVNILKATKVEKKKKKKTKATALGQS